MTREEALEAALRERLEANDARSKSLMDDERWETARAALAMPKDGARPEWTQEEMLTRLRSSIGEVWTKEEHRARLLRVAEAAWDKGFLSSIFFAHSAGLEAAGRAARRRAEEIAAIVEGVK